MTGPGKKPSAFEKELQRAIVEADNASHSSKKGRRARRSKGKRRTPSHQSTPPTATSIHMRKADTTQRVNYSAVKDLIKANKELILSILNKLKDPELPKKIHQDFVAVGMETSKAKVLSDKKIDISKFTNALDYLLDEEKIPKKIPRKRQNRFLAGQIELIFKAIYLQIPDISHNEPEYCTIFNINSEQPFQCLNLILKLKALGAIKPNLPNDPIPIHDHLLPLIYFEAYTLQKLPAPLLNQPDAFNQANELLQLLTNLVEYEHIHADLAVTIASIFIPHTIVLKDITSHEGPPEDIDKLIELIQESVFKYYNQSKQHLSFARNLIHFFIKLSIPSDLLLGLVPDPKRFPLFERKIEMRAHLHLIIRAMILSLDKYGELDDHKPTLSAFANSLIEKKYLDATLWAKVSPQDILPPISKFKDGKLTNPRTPSLCAFISILSLAQKHNLLSPTQEKKICNILIQQSHYDSLIHSSNDIYTLQQQALTFITNAIGKGNFTESIIKKKLIPNLIKRGEAILTEPQSSAHLDKKLQQYYVHELNKLLHLLFTKNLIPAELANNILTSAICKNSPLSRSLSPEYAITLAETLMFASLTSSYSPEEWAAFLPYIRNIIKSTGGSQLTDPQSNAFMKAIALLSSHAICQIAYSQQPILLDDILKHYDLRVIFTGYMNNSIRTLYTLPNPSLEQLYLLLRAKTIVPSTLRKEPEHEIHHKRAALDVAKRSFSFFFDNRSLLQSDLPLDILIPQLLNSLRELGEPNDFADHLNTLSLRLHSDSGWPLLPDSSNEHLVLRRFQLLQYILQNKDYLWKQGVDINGNPIDDALKAWSIAIIELYHNRQLLYENSPAIIKAIEDTATQIGITDQYSFQTVLQSLNPPTPQPKEDDRWTALGKKRKGQ